MKALMRALVQEYVQFMASNRATHLGSGTWGATAPKPMDAANKGTSAARHSELKKSPIRHHQLLQFPWQLPQVLAMPLA
jgi:hypothetical protein